MEQYIFYAATIVGSVVSIDVRSGQLIKTYRGHQGVINNFIEFQIKNEIVDKCLIITAGDDSKINIYEI